MKTPGESNCQATKIAQTRGHQPLTMHSQQYEIALSIFEKVRTAFPELSMKLELAPKHVDLAMKIPMQPGLSFDMDLNLQNLDELHIEASRLWVEWFPCTNLSEAEGFFEAVTGLLSGKFRILEHWRGNRAVKAQLQRPSGGGWENVATWLDLLSIPWPPKNYKVVQNLPVNEAMRERLVTP